MKYVHTNREDVQAAMEKLPFRKASGDSPFRKGEGILQQTNTVRTNSDNIRTS
jgi:hypothetical protein